MKKDSTFYNAQKIEKKWQKEWEKSGIYKAKGKVKGKNNFYHLVMLPYSSGDLHIGHWYNFGPADIYARLKRMQGFNVMSPIGFDAFGLPAENAAIKRKIHPKAWTNQNIRTMTRQLKTIGAVYDWSRTVNTSAPEYYKWTQWIFLQLYKAGLAYRAKTPANWCPSCKTILANEQVVNEKCERCDSEVSQKQVEQWLFKITDYIEPLLKDLEKIDWPKKTKAMQKNWIGKSEGALIKFSIFNSQFSIKVFTTRPDTILGATFLVLSPDHPRVKNYKSKNIQNYINRTNYGREKEKTGVFTGDYAINPATREKIPIWIADYVLMKYGTGAIMGVPAYDERDLEFAKKHKLPIKKTKLVDAEKVVKEIKGKWKLNYKLRDWIISRQRYWGAPIPMVNCNKCGWQPVPEKDLPVLLPNIKDFQPTGTGESPLAKSEKFVNAKCPKCNGKAKRETDTMDTFVCSSWYFLRYTDPNNKKQFASPDKLKAWMPVNMYIGGAEHTVLHLLYARFFTKVLRKLRHLNFNEPFSSLRHQGIILGADGQKMSKSKGNVVDPDKQVAKYGADVIRMYLCFMGPYEQGGPWQPKGITGIIKFLDKIFNFQFSIFNKFSISNDQKKLLHQTIKKVTEDIENFRFNTAISALMILANKMQRSNACGLECIKSLLLMLAPFAPHLTEELWHKIGNKKSIHLEKWPNYDTKLIKEDQINLIIQINGKVRDKLKANSGISKSQAQALAIKQEKTQKYIKRGKIKKVVFVPDKLINLVI